jgi:hypothetical protein
MSDNSTKLNLPFLSAGQAQKHVTVNETLLRLDALVQLSVISATETDEPDTPADGDLYILPPGKSGNAWDAMANLAVAYYRDGVWEELTPRPGWRAWIADGDALAVYDGSAWTALTQTVSARNVLINGDFAIWQRGTSGASGYLADRWLAASTTSVSRQTDTPSGEGARYSIEFGNSSAAASSIEQRIEAANATALAGKPVTFSFWARSMSSATPLNFEIARANAADNFSATTAIASGELAATPSGSWTRYSASVSLPAEAVNGVIVRIKRGSAGASTTRVALAQLELGAAASAFGFRTVGAELALCERYFQKSFDLATTPADGVSAGQISVFSRASTDQFAVVIGHRFLTRMRTSPTMAFFNPNTSNTKKIYDAGAAAHRAIGAVSVGASGFTIIGLDTGETTTASALHQTQYSADAEL